MIAAIEPLSNGEVPRWPGRAIDPAGPAGMLGAAGKRQGPPTAINGEGPRADLSVGVEVLNAPRRPFPTPKPSAEAQGQCMTI